MKKELLILCMLFLSVPLLFAQQNADAPAETEDAVVTETVPLETEDALAAETTPVETEIENRVSAVTEANPGDYILLPSGRRYVITGEEIEIANGRFNYDDLSGVRTETLSDGTEIKTISEAHTAYIYPDGQSIHILKTSGSFTEFMQQHIERNYFLGSYIDISGNLHDSRPNGSPLFYVFRASVHFQTISDGIDEVEAVIVKAWNYNGENFVMCYFSTDEGWTWSRHLRTGFSNLFIEPDKVMVARAQLPVSTAALPSTVLREIAYRSVKVGETRSLADAVTNRNLVSWTSSTPSTVSVDSNGTITGLQIGNGYIGINETEYISVVVVPGEAFFLLPESGVALLPEESKTNNSSTTHLTEYRTEPTFRLSYRFNNKGEEKGASGPNGGVDILGRGPDYQWLWTTYYQGGWFYDLNGVQREMINGYQKDIRNGIELIVRPEFVYDNGVPYLQLRHILRNPTGFTVTGQRFGATADVMIHNNDDAPLVHTPYGAYMTDNENNPSLELMFVCESGDGITPVDTLWLGGYYAPHLDYIYEDQRFDVNGIDSAIGFSYQNIELAPGETKEFIVRFTLARTEK